MSKIAGAFTFPAMVLGALLHPTVAEATAVRTWVSGVGNDANPCTRASPCATLAAAYANTASGGEIDVLDRGNYGSLTIGQAITIANDGTGTATIAPIFINAGPSDAVVLRGLNLTPLGGGSFIAGVAFRAGGSLLVDHCVIRDFASTPGIAFWPSRVSSLWVKDTLFFNDGTTNAASLSIAGLDGAEGLVTAEIDRVQFFGGAATPSWSMARRALALSTPSFTTLRSIDLAAAAASWRRPTAVGPSASWPTTSRLRTTPAMAFAPSARQRSSPSAVP
jgi:hypothetical protein